MGWPRKASLRQGDFFFSKDLREVRNILGRENIKFKDFEARVCLCIQEKAKRPMWNRVNEEHDDGWSLVAGKTIKKSRVRKGYEHRNKE